MTTSPADSDCLDTISQSLTREAAECEVGLRRILAYICAKNHRRWIAYGIVLLVIYTALAKLLSWLITLLFTLGIPAFNIFPTPVMLGIALQALDFVPLLIALLLLLKLHRIARGY